MQVCLIPESLHTYSPVTYISVFIFDFLKNFFFELLEAVVSKVKSMNYKAKLDKTKGEGRSKGGRWVCIGWGGGVGRKCRQL